MKRVFGIILMIGGCYSPNVGNGQLKCSSDGKCPEGFHCATDRSCWKDGSDPMPSPPPPDMTIGTVHDLSVPSGVDMTGVDMTGPAVLPGHTGNSVMSGGVTAKSEHYKIIMSTGQPPGGNSSAAGTTTKKKGGLVGATQGK